MRAEASEPLASRPTIKGMGIPATDDGLLPWRWARERLEQALVYWVASVRPDARPHVMANVQGRTEEVPLRQRLTPRPRSSS